MKRIALLIAAVGIYSSSSVAQDLPKPSPSAEVEQTIGLTEVEIEYSRPSAKGRTVWGDLVPYQKLWRTGANKNTIIEFSTDAKVGGKEVAAGEYALFINPDEKAAIVHLNSVIDGWGTGKYADSNDVLVAEVEVKDQEATTETMLFYFDDVTSGSANLVLAWANKQIVIPIEVDYIAQSLKNIEEAIAEDGENFRVFNNAASFYLDNDLEADKAVSYAKKSVELEEKFWNVKTLSEAYAANNQYKEALEAAKKSLAMSEKAEYEPYIKMNKANIEKWSSM